MYKGKKGEVLLLLALALVIAGLGYIALLGDTLSITGAGTYGLNDSTHCGRTINDSTNLTGNISGCIANGLDFNDTFSGIELDCKGYALIGTLGGGDEGIGFRNAQTNRNLSIRNCIVRNFTAGITPASNNIRANWSIINTTVDNSTDGILIQTTSGGNLINNSRIRSNSYGIRMSSTNSNISAIITNSNISGNTVADIYAVESSSGDWNLTIFNNFIQSRMNITSGVRRASIYNNRFDGTVLILSNGNAENVTWNTSYTTGLNIMGGPRIGGNYYSNYTGSDTDDDGIGDTANYSLPGSGGHTDFLPLVQTYQFTHPSSGTLAESLLANSTFNLTNAMTNLSNHSTAQNITFYNGTSGRKYLRVYAYFNQTVDLSNLKIAGNNSAVAVNFAGTTGVDTTNHTLYLPNPGYRDGVFICPDATNLAHVQWNCTNIQVISKKNISDGARIGGILVREDGNEYEIENVSGSGGSVGNITCGSVNESITLNQHITTNGTCFYVNASNIVINGAGFNITSNGSGDGINADRGYDNITIRNFGGIMRFNRGIEATDMNVSLIFNNTINSSNSFNGHAIRLDNSSNANISNNILSVSGQNGYGSFLFISNTSYVASNTITSSRNTSAGGVTLSGTDSATVENNIFITEGDSIQFVIGGGRGASNNIILNNNLSAVSGKEITDLTNATDFNYLIYNNSLGQIEWIDNGTSSLPGNLTINVTNSFGIGLGLNLFIANNTVALNTSAFSRSINTSANITMYGLNLTRISQIRKVENYTTNSTQIIDAGSDCITAGTCLNLSYSGSTLIFNTTSFSSFAATETSVCGSISVNTTLGNSITTTGTCFTITASNIVLDGGGYSITSSTGSGIGINNTGYENVTIRDFAGINNFSTAILLFNTANASARNNTIFNNTIQSSNTSSVTTVDIQNSNFTNVTQNTITTNASEGTALGFITSHRNWIMSNTILTANSSSDGIALADSSGNNVSSNTVTTFGAGGQGISISTSSITNYLSLNTIVTRVAEGILIDTSSNSNTIYANTINATDEGSSISSSTNITLERNTIRTFGSTAAGILFSSGSGNDNFIRNNSIFTNGSTSPGISLDGTTNTNITLNTINTSHNNSEGIILTTASDTNNIISNVIYTNRTSSPAIDIVVSASNNISSNTIITWGNASAALRIASTSLRTFAENNVLTTFGNFSSGILLTPASANNTFLNNNITADLTNELNDSTVGSTFNYLIYNNSFGQIRWTNTSFLELLNVNVTNSFGIGLDRNVFIANNTAAVNASAFAAGINSSANITLYGLNVSDVDEIRRVETYTTTSADILSSGTDCLTAGSCINFSFGSSTLRFNTTSFSSFAVIDMIDCGNITTNITLDRNITTTGSCFIIRAASLTLDGSGYSITSSTGSGIGVNSTSFNNVTIRDFAGINNFSNAILLSGSLNNSVVNNTIQSSNGTLQFVIDVQSSNLTNLTQNAITSNATQGPAVILTGSSHGWIMSNTILTANSSSDGIILSNSRGNNLSSNTITTISGNSQGITLTSTATANYLSQNTIITRVAEGILVSSSPSNVLYSNTINSSDDGISINGSVNTTTERNLIRTSLTDAIGIYFSGTSGEVNFVNNNTLFTNATNSQGIYLETTNNTNISLNRINTSGNDSSGIVVSLSSDNNFIGNIIFTNRTNSDGISIALSHRNNLTSNIILTHGNDSMGIIISGVSINNYFENNNVTTRGNHSFGISLSSDSGLDSENITFLNNNVSSDFSNEFNDSTSTAVFNYLIYNNSLGQIEWTGSSFLGSLVINVSNSFGMGLDRNLFIGNGSIGVNTSAFNSGGVNSSANITLYATGLSEVGVVRRLEEYETNSNTILNTGRNCFAASCELISFSGGTLLFNTTSFSSFAAAANSPPNITTPAITPEPAFRNNSLSANVTYTDINANVGTVVFQWYVNGTNVYNQTNTSVANGSVVVSTLNTGNFSKNNTINVTIYANDTDNSTFVSDLLNISNAPPFARAVNLTISDHLNRTNGTLFGNWTFVDIDSDDPLRNETRWFNNTIEVTLLENSTTAGPGNTTRNQAWVFSIRVFDGTNWSNFVNSSAMNISNAAPEQFADILDITLVVGDVTTRNLSTYFRDIDNDALNHTARNITIANLSINDSSEILTITALSVGSETTNITATDNFNTNTSNPFIITINPAVDSGSGDGGGGSSPKYVCKSDADCPPTTERYCLGSKVQEKTISSICQNPKTVRAQCVPGKELKSRAVEDCKSGCSGGACILEKIPLPSEAVSGGISCPPGTELINQSCINITPLTPIIVGNFQEIEQLFPEENVFPTVFPKIFSVQDPTVTGLNCVVPSGDAITTISESTLNKAKEAYTAEETAFLYDIDGSHFKLILALFEEPGELCLGVDIRCPTPERDNFWQFQSVFSRGFSSFTDEFCIPLDGNPLLIGQDFKMCSTLQQEIDQCQVLFTPKLRKK